MHSISRNLLILLLTSASNATPVPLVTTSATPDSPCSLPNGVLIYPGQQKVFPENFSCLIYECTAENGLVTIVGDCSTPFCLDAKYPTFDSCCRECPNGQNCLLPNGEILNGTEERAIGGMFCKCPESGDDIGPQEERHITAVCEPLPMLTSIISPAAGSDTVIQTMSLPETKCQMHDGTILYPGQRGMDRQNASSCVYYECTEENQLKTVAFYCKPPRCVDAQYLSANSCCPHCPNGQNCRLPNGEILEGTGEQEIEGMSCKCPWVAEDVGYQDGLQIEAECQPLSLTLGIITSNYITSATEVGSKNKRMLTKRKRCTFPDGTILRPGQKVMIRQNLYSCAYHTCISDNRIDTLVVTCSQPMCEDAQYLNSSVCCLQCPIGQICRLPNNEILKGSGERVIGGMSCKCPEFDPNDETPVVRLKKAECHPLSGTLKTTYDITNNATTYTTTQTVTTPQTQCHVPNGTDLFPGQRVMIRQGLFSCAIHTCNSGNRIDTLVITCSQPMCEDAQYLNSSVCCLPCPVGPICRLPNGEILNGTKRKVIDEMSCKCPEIDQDDETPKVRLDEAKCQPLSSTLQTTAGKTTTATTYNSTGTLTFTTPETSCQTPNGTVLYPGQQVTEREDVFSCTFYTCIAGNQLTEMTISCSQPMCVDAQYLNSFSCCRHCPNGQNCRLPNGEILNGTQRKVIDGMSCKCPEIDQDDETPKVRLDEAKCQPLSSTLQTTAGKTSMATTYNSTGSLTVPTPETPCHTPNGTVLYPGQQVTEREDVFSCTFYTCIAGNQLTGMTISCSQPMCVDAQYLNSFSCCRHCPNGQNCRLPNGEILNGTEEKVIDGMSCKCPEIVPDVETRKVRLDEAKCQPLSSTILTTAGTTTTATTYNSTASLTVTTPETPCQTPNGTVLYPGQQVTEREDVFSCIFYTCIAGNQLTEMTISCSQPMCVDAQYLNSFSCCRHCPNGQNCRLPNGEILNGTERKVIGGMFCICPEVDQDDEVPNFRMDEAKCQPLSSTFQTTSGTTTITTNYNSIDTLTVTTPETPCQTPNGTVLYPGQEVTEREDVFSCIFYTCIAGNQLTGMTISCSQPMCVDAQYLDSFSCCRHCPNGQNCRLPNDEILNGTEVKVIEGMLCECPDVHPNVGPPSAECQPQPLTLGVISITAPRATIASANTITFNNTVTSLFTTASSSTATPTIIASRSTTTPKISASSNTSTSIEFSASSSTTTPTTISAPNSTTTPTTISAPNSTTTPTINASSNTTTLTNISASSNTPTISTSNDTTTPTTISAPNSTTTPTINASSTTTTLTNISASSNTPTISTSNDTTTPTTISAPNSTTTPTINASSTTTTLTNISASSNTPTISTSNDTTTPTTISASISTTTPTINASSTTTTPTNISASSNTPTISTSNDTTIPTNISAPINTTTLTTISASIGTATSTISASSNFTAPINISTSSNTPIISASNNTTTPTSISASSNTPTISASSNTTTPTNIYASSNTPISSAPNNTTTPTSISASSNTPTISASSNTTTPTTISTSSNTTTLTTISVSSNTTTLTTISVSSNTPIPTTISASGNTTIPTNISASSNTTTSTTISTSSNTIIPINISAASNTIIPITIPLSSNTTITTTIPASINATIPITISLSSNSTTPTTISASINTTTASLSASSNTTTPTNISLSSNTNIPTTISTSSNTTIPITFSASSNTTIPTNFSASSNATIRTNFSASSNTTIPITFSASSNTTIPTNFSASSNATIRTNFSASSNTTISTTFSASSNTTITTTFFAPSNTTTPTTISTSSNTTTPTTISTSSNTITPTNISTSITIPTISVTNNTSP